jgi:hypothetical protein
LHMELRVTLPMTICSWPRAPPLIS